MAGQKILTERALNVPEGSKVQMKRLGVTGPAQKVSLPMVDISKSMGGSPSVTVRKIEDKHVIIRLQCQQCPRDFFTMQGYNNHLFMDHKIRKVDDYPPKTITSNEHSMSTSYGSGQFDAILNDEDEASKEAKGDVVPEIESNLPTINPPKKKVSKKKTTTKKYVADQKCECDICGERFFTDDGVRLHKGHAHDKEWQEYTQKLNKKDSPSEDKSPSDESQRGRKRRRGNNDNDKWNESVGRRKRKIEEEKNSENTEEIAKSVSGRRTRSSSRLLSQQTNEAEEERKRIKMTDSSQELSKEEIVKTYNLRKKDKPMNKTTGSEISVLEKPSNDVNQPGGSENMDDNGNSVKPTGKPNEIEIVFDAVPVDNNNVEHSDLSGNIDSGQDSAYRTEKESTEVTQSSMVDDTLDDPDFDAEKEPENSTDVTVTTEEKSKDEMTGYLPYQGNKGKTDNKKKGTKSDNKKGNTKGNSTSVEGIRSEDTEKDETNDNSKPNSDTLEDGKKKKGEGKSVKSNQKSENTVGKKQRDPDDDDDEEDQFYYYCDKCSNKFNDWKELQKHKLDCVKVAKKFICTKCNRGFQQKTMMEQHFDFYHTNKPKCFVCNEHKKCYVFKKSYDEHLRRDHSKGKYRFVCDYCGRGFYHRGEFTIHWDSVHLNRRDYACNKCQQRAFTSVGRLNAHLEKCGKQPTHECGICGKMFHSKENLYTHIQDVHQTDHTRKCPFCNEKVYTSEGGYYKHLRVKHNISRQTVKLSEYMKAQSEGATENNEEEPENTDNSKPKPKSGRKRSKSSENMEDTPETPSKKSKKSKGGNESEHNEKTEEKNNINKGKQQQTEDPKPKKKGKGQDNGKGNDDQSATEKPTKAESYPAKRTKSSGPVTWDCPFCEDIKYTDNLQYLAHLQKVHKCGLLPERGQKETPKGKDKKGKKGKGKK